MVGFAAQVARTALARPDCVALLPAPSESQSGGLGVLTGCQNATSIIKEAVLFSMKCKSPNCPGNSPGNTGRTMLWYVEASATSDSGVTCNPRGPSRNDQLEASKGAQQPRARTRSVRFHTLKTSRFMEMRECSSKSRRKLSQVPRSTLWVT